MKKIIAALTVISLLALSISTFAFAEEKTPIPQWYKDMLTWKKAQITQGVKDGTLTQKQADAWNKQIDYMEKWYSENGFDSGMMGGFRGNFGPRANGGSNHCSGSGTTQGFYYN